MPHENYRAVVFGDDALGRGHIVGECSGRILHDADAIAIFPQDPVDVFPAGTIDESAMYQSNRSRSLDCDIRHDRSPAANELSSARRRNPPELTVIFLRHAILKF